MTQINMLDQAIKPKIERLSTKLKSKIILKPLCKVWLQLQTNFLPLQLLMLTTNKPSITLAYNAILSNRVL